MFLCHNDGADDKARFPVISHVFAFDLKQTCKGGEGGDDHKTHLKRRLHKLLYLFE